MNESKTVTKDPICGMNVEKANALHAEKEGETYYFCGEHCRKKFLALPLGSKLEEEPGGCCG